MLHRFGSQFTLTFSDEARLRQQLAIVSRWTRRNLVIGVLFLLVAFLVPVRYIGLREFLRYSSSGGGYETLVRHSGGLLVFFLVGTVEGFLVYASRKERDRIKRDLEEKVKVILDGKVKGIDRSRFSTGPGNLVVQVGDMELDTFEIDSKFPRGHYRGVPVKVAIALHSQVVLAVEAAG
jgi:hypothetical protein